MHIDTPGFYVTAAEDEKLALYRRSWPAPRPRVVPLAASTTGRFGGRAVGFFERVTSEQIDDARVLWRQHLSVRQRPVFWRRQLTVALVVHVALVLSNRLAVAHARCAPASTADRTAARALRCCQLPSYYAAAHSTGSLAGDGDEDVWHDQGTGFRRSDRSI